MTVIILTFIVIINYLDHLFIILTFYYLFPLIYIDVYNFVIIKFTFYFILILQLIYQLNHLTIFSFKLIKL